MRYAYIASSVHRRRDLAHGPVDAEWLLANRARFEPVVLVDHDSAGAQDLRDAGIDVVVSPKRTTPARGAEDRSADHVQAHMLAQEHQRRPFDFLIYSSGMTTDLAWFEPILAGIPRGVTPGEGLVPDVRLITGDASLFQHFGRSLWAAAGFLSAADFVLADVPMSSYGFRDEVMPSRLSTGLLDHLAVSPVPDEPPRLLLVAATTAGVHELAGLVPRAEAAVPIDGGTTIVVLHQDLPVGPDTTRDLLVDGCPAGLAQATILVTPAEDGVAASFAERADLVVAAGPAELAIPAVADAARRAGLVLLSGDLPPLAPHLAGAPEGCFGSGDVVVVTTTGWPAALSASVDELLTSADVETVLLHDPGFADEAHRFIGGRGRFDLAVLGLADPVYGAPDPTTPCMHVLAFGRTAWPAVRRRMASAGSLHELILWVLNLDLVEHARLLVLPGTGRGCEPLPGAYIAGLPTWTSSTGALPRPNLGGVGATPEAEVQASLMEWAAAHGWSDRARLALPWRAGLLKRAMRNRW